MRGVGSRPGEGSGPADKPGRNVRFSERIALAQDDFFFWCTEIDRHPDKYPVFCIGIEQ